MNASDILKYGHLTFCGSFEGLPDAEWEIPGACGTWSVKNIVAHIASYELVLTDILNDFVDKSAPKPYLSIFGKGFNDSQVDMRKEYQHTETLDEYNKAHTQNMALITQIAPETLRQVGTIPWYGADYSVDDLIVYMIYGHKREHSAQISALHDNVTSNRSFTNL